jgi:hypothetical protein
MKHQEIPVLWRTSTWSNGTNCVEVAAGGGTVRVRDSGNRSGPRLAVPSAAWQVFTRELGRSSHEAALG